MHRRSREALTPHAAPKPNTLKPCGSSSATATAPESLSSRVQRASSPAERIGAGRSHENAAMTSERRTRAREGTSGARAETSYPRSEPRLEDRLLGGLAAEQQVPVTERNLPGVRSLARLRSYAGRAEAGAGRSRVPRR